MVLQRLEQYGWHRTNSVPWIWTWTLCALAFSQLSETLILLLSLWCHLYFQYEVQKSHQSLTYVFHLWLLHAHLFRGGAVWSPVDQKQGNFLDRLSITGLAQKNTFYECIGVLISSHLIKFMFVWQPLWLDFKSPQYKNAVNHSSIPLITVRIDYLSLSLWSGTWGGFVKTLYIILKSTRCLN